MTSVISAYAVTKQGLTRFVKPESPSYNNGTNTVLFPFSYNNGILDITYNGNNFQTLMVDIPNQDPIAESATAIQILSGPYLVTRLGNNFKDYIRAWRDGIIDADSPINIYINPQILKVQQADLNNINANNNNVYLVSTEAPASDEYTAGSTASEYDTTYVFKTPLTFTIVEGGVTKYITFRTALDQE